MALCTKQTSHKVTHITLQQVQNMSTKKSIIGLDKSLIIPKITAEASSQVNLRQSQSPSQEEYKKIFRNILQNTRYFVYPPVSIRQQVL